MHDQGEWLRSEEEDYEFSISPAYQRLLGVIQPTELLIDHELSVIVKSSEVEQPHQQS